MVATIREELQLGGEVMRIVDDIFKVFALHWALVQWKCDLPNANGKQCYRSDSTNE